MPKYKRKSHKSRTPAKSHVASPVVSSTASSTASDSNTNMFIAFSVIFSIVSIIYQITQLSNFVTKKDTIQDDTKQDDTKQGGSNLDKPASPIVIVIVIGVLISLGILLDYLWYGELRIFRNLYRLLRTFF